MDKHNWTVAIANSAADTHINIYHVYGTKEQVIQYIHKLVDEDIKNETEEMIVCITDSSNTQSSNDNEISIQTTYESYDIEYTATIDTEPQKL